MILLLALLLLLGCGRSPEYIAPTPEGCPEAPIWSMVCCCYPYMGGPLIPDPSVIDEVTSVEKGCHEALCSHTRSSCPDYYVPPDSGEPTPKS